MKLRAIRRRTNGLTEVKRWGFHWYYKAVMGRAGHHSRRKPDGAMHEFLRTSGTVFRVKPLTEWAAPRATHRRIICTWNIHGFPSASNGRRLRKAGAP